MNTATSVTGSFGRLFAVAPEPRRWLRWARGVLVVVPALGLFILSVSRGDTFTAVTASYLAVLFGVAVWLPTSVGRGIAALVVALVSVGLLGWADDAGTSIGLELYIAPVVLALSGVADVVEDWPAWRLR